MNTTLNLRIPADLKNLIESKAEEENLPSSQVARKILEDYFYQSEESIDEEILHKEKEYNYLVSQEEDQIEKQENIIYTARFIQLICWIYDQRTIIPKTHDAKRYEAFQETIIELNGSKEIRKKLKEEFNKVLSEIIQKKHNLLYKFKFAEVFNFNGFNYGMLNELIYDKLKKGEICNYSL